MQQQVRRTGDDRRVAVGQRAIQLDCVFQRHDVIIGGDDQCGAGHTTKVSGCEWETLIDGSGDLARNDREMILAVGRDFSMGSDHLRWPLTVCVRSHDETGGIEGAT